MSRSNRHRRLSEMREFNLSRTAMGEAIQRLKAENATLKLENEKLRTVVVRVHEAIANGRRARREAAAAVAAGEVEMIGHA